MLGKLGDTAGESLGVNQKIPSDGSPGTEDSIVFFKAVSRYSVFMIFFPKV